MTRKHVITYVTAVVFLAVVIIFSALYKINTTNEAINYNDYSSDKINSHDLEQEYKNKLKAIIPAYRNIFQSHNLGEIDNVRDQLLTLKMPAEYRERHAQLVLLLDSLKVNTDFNAAQQKFEALIASYDQL